MPVPGKKSESGAVTKVSNLFTALVILVFILDPHLLEHLPYFSLAVLMIFTGWKMVVGLTRRMWRLMAASKAPSVARVEQPWANPIRGSGIDLFGPGVIRALAIQG